MKILAFHLLFSLLRSTQGVLVLSLSLFGCSTRKQWCPDSDASASKLGQGSMKIMGGT